MSLEKFYKEVWTCDSCGEQLVCDELPNLLFKNDDPPDGWYSFGFLKDEKVRYKPQYDLCPKCIEIWNTETNLLLAKLVFNENQLNALNAGVPLADILGE